MKKDFPKCNQRIGRSEYFCTKKLGHEGMCVVSRIFLNGVEQLTQAALFKGRGTNHEHES